MVEANIQMFALVRKLSVEHDQVLPGGKLRLHNKTYEISGVTNLYVIALRVIALRVIALS